MPEGNNTGAKEPEDRTKVKKIKGLRGIQETLEFRWEKWRRGGSRSHESATKGKRSYSRVVGNGPGQLMEKEGKKKAANPGDIFPR